MTERKKSNVLQIRRNASQKHKVTRDDKEAHNLKYRRLRLGAKIGLDDKTLTREERLIRVSSLITAVIEQEALLIAGTATSIEVISQMDAETKKTMIDDRAQVLKQVKDMLSIESSIRRLSKAVGDEDRARKEDPTSDEMESSLKKDEIVDKTLTVALQMIEDSNISKQEATKHVKYK